jgi:hypothetical protein
LVLHEHEKFKGRVILTGKAPREGYTVQLRQPPQGSPLHFPEYVRVAPGILEAEFDGRVGTITTDYMNEQITAVGIGDNRGGGNVVTRKTKIVKSS